MLRVGNADMGKMPRSSLLSEYREKIKVIEWRGRGKTNEEQ